MRAHILIKTIFVLSICLMTSSLSADTFIYNLTTNYSGTPPTGTSPFLIATVSDVSKNKVNITMNASGIINPESVGDWYFNLISSLDPTKLSFSQLSGQEAKKIATGTGIAASTGGLFQIDFTFDSKFTQGTSSSYNITLEGLTAAAFNVKSLPNGGTTSYTAASINEPDNKTGFIKTNTAAIPEPTTFLILGGFLTFVLLLKERRKSQKIKL